MFFKGPVIMMMALSAVALLSGCAVQPIAKGEDFWQRVDPESALYTTGPKAQQILEQHIATCVAEINELVKLNAVRDVTPPLAHDEYLRSLENDDDLSHWDTPSYRGNLMVDHSDYHDFESCMYTKGWERVSYVGPHVAKRSRKNYQETQNLRKYGYTGRSPEETREAMKAKENFNSLNN